MGFQLHSTLGLLRALGLPLAPAERPETSHKIGGEAGVLLRNTAPARFQLPAEEAFEFELAPYPSDLRRQSSIELNDDGSCSSTATSSIGESTHPPRPGRHGEQGSSISSPSSSRSASPAPSTCSSAVPRCRLGRRKQSAKRPQRESKQEAEILWRQHWD